MTPEEKKMMEEVWKRLQFGACEELYSFMLLETITYHLN